MEDAVRAEFDADRRACVLKLLREAGGSANNRTISTVLRVWGHDRDPLQVLDDFRYLKNLALVEVEELRADVQVATILDRGERVALGRESVAGIKRPR